MQHIAVAIKINAITAGAEWKIPAVSGNMPTRIMPIEAMIKSRAESRPPEVNRLFLRPIEKIRRTSPAKIRTVLNIDTVISVVT